MKVKVTTRVRVIERRERQAARMRRRYLQLDTMARDLGFGNHHTLMTNMLGAHTDGSLGKLLRSLGRRVR